jgi:hypothetical protein
MWGSKEPHYNRKETMKFKNIFQGLTIAYGQYQKGENNGEGKQKGKAFIVRKNVTDDLWENHINGVGPE